MDSQNSIFIGLVNQNAGKLIVTTLRLLVATRSKFCVYEWVLGDEV